MSWIDIGAVAAFAPNEAKEVVVADQVLAVFNVDGVLYAMDGLCPHQGGPLGRGELTGCVLTCPWHGLQFDVRDGQCQLSEGMHQTLFEVKVEGERVLVSLGSG